MFLSAHVDKRDRRISYARQSNKQQNERMIRIAISNVVNKSIFIRLKIHDSFRIYSREKGQFDWYSTLTCMVGKIMTKITDNEYSTRFSIIDRCFAIQIEEKNISRLDSLYVNENVYFFLFISLILYIQR